MRCQINNCVDEFLMISIFVLLVHFVVAHDDSGSRYCGTNNFAYESPFENDVFLTRDVILDTYMQCEGTPKYRATCVRSSRFEHGVASGDPEEDSIVLWTRVTVDRAPTYAVLQVSYTVALDENMRDILHEGSALTSSTVDFVVKVFVDDLLPSSQYYYQFHTCDKRVNSPIGSTKTLPSEDSSVESVTFATVHGSLFTYGSFVAYTKLAERAEEIDAVIHLGNYIYEEGNIPAEEAEWFNMNQSRIPIGSAHIPPHSLVSLDDYRLRYSQYRQDPDLLELHRLLPFIVIPDEQEISDNAGDMSDEFPWGRRTSAGLRAWFEWMPVRQSPANQRIFKHFKFGDLVHLIMMDARHDNRIVPANSSIYFDEQKQKSKVTFDRKIMTDDQIEWASHLVTGDSTKWKVIGSQVPFTNIIKNGLFVEVEALLSLPDSWAGFEESRKEMLNVIEPLSNVVILSGGANTAAALNVMKKKNGEHYGVEFVAPSVNAAGLGEILRYGLRRSEKSIAKIEKKLRTTNELLSRIDSNCHGYMLTQFTADRAVSRYFCVEGIHDPSNRAERELWTLHVCDGKSRVLDRSEPCTSEDPSTK